MDSLSILFILARLLRFRRLPFVSVIVVRANQAPDLSWKRQPLLSFAIVCVSVFADTLKDALESDM